LSIWQEAARGLQTELPQGRSTATEEKVGMSTYVETWKGIAHALGRSERWCRYMAQRAADPLPVFKVGGIVRLNGDDLADWLLRQRERSLTPVAVAADARERAEVNLKLIA
jgi:hypothetical protein